VRGDALLVAAAPALLCVSAMAVTAIVVWLF
jgi:hypothetical protein